MKHVLAIFDYCDTIFFGQSLDHFFAYLQKVAPAPWGRRIFVKFKNRWTHDNHVYKLNMLSLYRGRTQEEILRHAKTFYETVLRPRHFSVMIERLQDHHRKGHRVIVLSAGLQEYLRWLQHDQPIEDVVASKLRFQNGVFTGDFDGPECHREQKWTYLQDLVDVRSVDWGASFVYTDHRDDQVLLEKVGHPVVVGTSPQPPSWMPAAYEYLNVK